jgi:hypothetical protein
MVRDSDIFGEASETTAGYVTEHLVARLKSLDIPANRFYASGDIGAEDLPLGLEQSELEAEQERLAPQEMPIGGIHGCRVEAYQDFIVLGRRFFYLFELKRLR